MCNKEFKVGDKVRRITNSKLLKVGGIYKIRDILAGHIRVEGCDTHFDPDYFELVEDNNNAFDVNLLKTGMRVTFASGSCGIVFTNVDDVNYKGKDKVIVEFGFRVWDDLDKYKEIVKVEQSKNLKSTLESLYGKRNCEFVTIWEKKQKTKQQIQLDALIAESEAMVKEQEEFTKKQKALNERIEALKQTI